MYMKFIFSLIYGMELNDVHNLHAVLEESKFTIKRSIKQ